MTGVQTCALPIYLGVTLRLAALIAISFAVTLAVSVKPTSAPVKSGLAITR